MKTEEFKTLAGISDIGILELSGKIDVVISSKGEGSTDILVGVATTNAHNSDKVLFVSDNLDDNSVTSKIVVNMIRREFKLEVFSPLNPDSIAEIQKVVSPVKLKEFATKITNNVLPLRVLDATYAIENVKDSVEKLIGDQTYQVLLDIEVPISHDWSDNDFITDYLVEVSDLFSEYCTGVMVNLQTEEAISFENAEKLLLGLQERSSLNFGNLVVINQHSGINNSVFDISYGQVSQVDVSRQPVRMFG